MSIHDFLNKINTPKNREDWAVLAVVLMVGLASFGLGRLSVEREASGVQNNDNRVIITDASYYSPATLPAEQSAGISSKKDYVASRNGTKYYKTTCSGADNIKEENKIYFVSEEEAMSSGYERSSTCKY